MKLTHTNFEYLLTDLTKSIQQASKHEKNLDLSSLRSSEQQETSMDDSLWSARIEFLDFLCYLQYPKDCLKRLATSLEEYYVENNSYLKAVKSFATNYTSENAIQWYAQDTFVYRLINKVLRQHNIKALFLFGFLVKDIYEQLKREHDKFKLTHSGDNNTNSSIVKFYRGQLMSLKEFNS
ncbi:unnamed protein product [Rotaria sp. Silwood2]|nr:unnamed protein product [Rotaria sp. Silwood2]CAF2835343.1 unnamed protein product [Rotaria sp. Silwood2]CAF3239670.1 unnamed protein product [Rotaria sp. Silwood2]CAF4224938.1 unnamed protein product [Rotaria sp. Silwood2]CAF4225494.1 unnamed protein product [Rotaria sp. Silwood2]